jgi:hypothetical protein
MAADKSRFMMILHRAGKMNFQPVRRRKREEKKLVLLAHETLAASVNSPNGFNLS